MDIEKLLKSLLGGVGSVVAKQIAEALGNGLDIDALKDKNEQIIKALKDISKKVDDLTDTISDAVRMTQITAARDRIYNTLEKIKDSILVPNPRPGVFIDMLQRLMVCRTKTNPSMPKQSSPSTPTKASSPSS